MCVGAREGKEQEEVIYRKERDDSKKRNSKIGGRRDKECSR